MEHLVGRSSPGNETAAAVFASARSQRRGEFGALDVQLIGKLLHAVVAMTMAVEENVLLPDIAPEEVLQVDITDESGCGEIEQIVLRGRRDASP